jgi:TolB-like protein/class 3 adenylate cyclase/Tfp pilus assembly protein PilF
MADEGYERKLTAILSADVEGYSRLMDDDEGATVRTLTSYRTAISDLVQRYGGRVVDFPGDNILAEFKSVVDAVNCAVEIQRDLAERNAELPDERNMQFRIGVNLGDVIHEEERLYGDGVNIAARIESLSDAGGICISHSAYDQIKNKLKLGYEYLGDHQVKNIKDPVRVYKVLMDPEDAGKLLGQKLKPSGRKWIWSTVVVAAILVTLVGYLIYQQTSAPKYEPASIDRMSYPLPTEPSIAVLPFDNMSDDPRQEFFSDGITEQIITSLSNVPFLFVIARNSTFVYKNKPVKAQQIAEELGVQYILEGSVQKSGDKVRITAQLIDALTGHSLWAERYERKIADIFVLFDEITMKIIAELTVELSASDLGKVSSIKTDNLRAYEKYLKGYTHLWNRTVGDTLEARKLALEAIDLDTQYGAAYRLLATTYIDEIYLHRVKSRKENLEKAEKFIQKSIEYSGYDYQIHEVLSNLYFLKRQFDKAIAEGQKAVELNPNSARSNFIYGMVLSLSTRYDEAIPVLEKALRLNPVKPVNYLNQLAFAYFYTKQYEKAISLWEQAVERKSNYYYGHMGLTAAYQITGKEDKARVSAEELIKVRPTFSVSILEKRAVTSDREGKMIFFEALRKAGLPEHPPSQ